MFKRSSREKGCFMCFSISMASTAEEIAEAFGVFTGDIPPLPSYYHVSGFSSPCVPVLVNHGGRHLVSLMKWGLVPSWIKNEDDADKIRFKTLNARSETADTLPSFRGSFKSLRCVVITDGFYEPHYRDGNSYPYYIRRKDSGIIPLGGLFAVSSFGGKKHLSFSILTLSASPVMAEIHNKKKRMPFILPPEREFITRWLDPELPSSDVKEMFTDMDVINFPDGGYKNKIDAYPVSKDIYKKGIINGSSLQDRFDYKELNNEELSF